MKQTASSKGKGAPSWDDPENEATNNFVSWGKEGDFVLGALLSAKQVPSTLPDKQGEMQFVYEIKVREAMYHVLDDKKRIVEEPIEPAAGDIVSVGGRKTIDSRMARIKVGQIVGLKFMEELPAKTRGYNPTKLIKVFTPKGRDGEFEFDAEVQNAQANADFENED